MLPLRWIADLNYFGSPVISQKTRFWSDFWMGGYESRSEKIGKNGRGSIFSPVNHCRVGVFNSYLRMIFMVKKAFPLGKQPRILSQDFRKKHVHCKPGGFLPDMDLGKSFFFDANPPPLMRFQRFQWCIFFSA